MYTAPCSELSEITAIEQRRVQCAKVGDARLARAEKRTAATEARIIECQREHDDACAQEAAMSDREIAKVRTRTDHKLSDIQANERAVRERREAAEAETRQLLAETESIRACFEDMRSRLQQDISEVDQNMEKALSGTNADVCSLSGSVEEEVRGILGGVSVESARVWSLEDHASFARDLTGAKTLDAPDPLPPRPILPFGETQNPFDGYGTYGLKPPHGAPRGFKEETTRRILDVKDARPKTLPW